MTTKREFHRVIFPRKLDETDFQALLAERSREAMTSPDPKAPPSRVESVLIEPQQTTIFLSGNSAGLKAEAAVLKSRFPEVKISKVSQAAATHPPKRGRAPLKKAS